MGVHMLLLRELSLTLIRTFEGTVVSW